MSKRGTVNDEPFEIPDGYQIVSDAYYGRLVAAHNILSDLDRSPNGRHRGDVESQDPTGTSQGNPYLTAGQRIGTTMSGDPIVVPSGRDFFDPSAWVEGKQ